MDKWAKDRILVWFFCFSDTLKHRIIAKNTRLIQFPSLVAWGKEKAGWTVRCFPLRTATLIAKIECPVTTPSPLPKSSQAVSATQSFLSDPLDLSTTQTANGLMPSPARPYLSATSNSIHSDGSVPWPCQVLHILTPAT